jgi:hypothetical protein
MVISGCEPKEEMKGKIFLQLIYLLVHENDDGSGSRSSEHGGRKRR